MQSAWPDAPVRALQQALADLPAEQAVAVALSGGTDSVALALVATQVCAQRGQSLYFFHIHHGLMPEADAWVAHLSELALLLDVPLAVRHVQVDLEQGLGIEASAREARYQALAALASEHQVGAILLAHHQQDQAETVLLRLLRGAGVLGLSAMQDDVSRQGMRLLRPWLDIERAQLVAIAQAFAARTGWQAVEDPSNADPQYKRGAFRTELVPVLEKHWPAWRQTLVRHARQAAEVSEVLDEVAASDWLTLDPDASGQSFSLKAWRDLSPPRQALVLRYWLGQQQVAMPGERRLADLMRQLRQLHALGHDRELLWQHGSHIVRCLRGRVSLCSG
ncbi:tRNA lysidine(34) synthetase TilS [Zwartia panacis]|uniref:tRNA lysidine(34) synthetase TilS n=1 Tax=Zwartia panacis TaxID=2683345 RepID=UPI0025B29427|nr:tRNA lysidine(34) synthetase TilS [Zwartia panacis]MDN4015502.1 tRNA lysidine(34) synthetase TilS [Zwartia panacis]